jgi:predicted AAA+ superfamily ATPase
MFSTYLDAGSFPEIKEVVNPRVYLQDLYDRVLTRDIAMRHGIRHIRTFKEIAGYVASNCGSKLTYQNVADAYDLGSIHTARNYVTYLQDAYLFFGVDAFSFKRKDRVRRPRKMYGIDTGLIRAVSGNQENRGLMLENIVFVELFRRGKTIHYYADAHGKYEVDFVVTDDSSPTDVSLIQVCTDLSRPQTRERELRGLVQTAKAFDDLPDEKLFVLTMDEKGTQELAGRQIACKPVWEWMLEGKLQAKGSTN